MSATGAVAPVFEVLNRTRVSGLDVARVEGIEGASWSQQAAIARAPTKNVGASPSTKIPAPRIVSARPWPRQRVLALRPVSAIGGTHLLENELGSQLEIERAVEVGI